ncbi:MAG: phosphohistidine phosphatase SixA [Chthoniobacterales bacterium]
MRIHLLRHADAEDFATSDAARVLTAKGREQAARVGEFLVRTRQPIDLILTSHYLRAAETARIVSEKLDQESPVEDRRLGCGLSPQTGLSIIQEYSSFNDVLLVGHQPDLGMLAAFLLTRDRSFELEFHKASLMSITMLQPAAGAGVLESYVNVSQM